jgi:hypothetical protein
MTAIVANGLIAEEYQETVLDSYLCNVKQNDFNKFTVPTCLRKNPKSEYRKRPRGPKQTQTVKSQ